MARPKIKPKIDESQLINNPLVKTDFKVKVREFTAKKELVDIGSIQDGVITNKPATIESKYIIEDEPFTKIYSSALLRKIVLGCTSKARDLLWFIVYELNPQEDWLWINKLRYMQEASVSFNTYKAAILELVRYNLISPTVYKDTYWVHPSFFFRGNRITKYPDKLDERI